MHRQTQGWVTVGALIVLSVLTAVGLEQLSRLDAKLSQAITQPRADAQGVIDMDPLTTTVKNQNGIEITVTTHREDEETDALQLARHLKRVALAEASGG